MRTIIKGIPVILIVLIEIGAIILIVFRIRKLVIKYRANKKDNIEPYFALRLSFSDILFSPAAEFLSNDLWLFYSVLILPFRRRKKEEGKKFTYHKQSFYPTVFAMVLSLMIFEAIAIHIFLLFTLPSHLWWIYLIVLLLNLYAVVWFVGDYINISRRPHLLMDKYLLLRLGIRFTGIIDYENIDSIQHTEQIPLKGKKKNRDSLFLALKDKCNVYLELKESIDFYTFFGLSSGLKKIFLYVDKPQDFIEGIKEKLDVKKNRPF
jgi:hypothetical protein